VAVHSETEVGMTARPLLGTQQPQCATDAEV